MKTVFTVYGGSVAADGSVTLSGAGQLLGWASALVFIWVLMASGAAWIMGAGRAQAAACMDGAGPRALGRISPRTGVPVVMGLVSGAVSLAAMAASLWVTRGDGQKYFSAALTVSIALIVLAYLLIYPAFLALRLRRPDLERPFLAPGGRPGAWLITVLATGWSLLVTACLLWPGLGTADPDASLPAGFEGQRLQFELLVLAPLAAVVAACTVFHLASRRPSSERRGRFRRGRGRTGRGRGCRRLLGHEPGDLGDHGRVAEDPAVAEAGGGDQAGVRPRAGDGRAVGPAGLGVLAVVDQQQGRGGDPVGHGGHVKGRHRRPDPPLEPGHQAGADALAEAEAGGEGPGVGERVGHGGDEHQAADRQAVAEGEGGRRRPEGVGDHGVGRAVGRHHRGQGVGELEDGAPARPLGTRVGAAVAGRVEGDHPEPGVDQRSDERVQLPAATRPIRAPGTRPGSRAPSGVAPDLAGDRAAVDLHLERAARLGQPVAAAAGAGDAEPEGLGPAGSDGGCDPLQQCERPNDRAFLDGGETAGGHRRSPQEAGRRAASSSASKARVARAAASGSPSSRLAWW